MTGFNHCKYQIKQIHTQISSWHFFFSLTSKFVTNDVFGFHLGNEAKEKDLRIQYPVYTQPHLS